MANDSTRDHDTPSRRIGVGFIPRTVRALQSQIDSVTDRMATLETETLENHGIDQAMYEEMARTISNLALYVIILAIIDGISMAVVTVVIIHLWRQ